MPKQKNAKPFTCSECGRESIGREDQHLCTRECRAAWYGRRHVIFERDGHVCFYCGLAKPVEIDHVVPISQGGQFRAMNLVACCRQCNARKRGQRMPSQLLDVVAYRNSRAGIDPTMFVPCAGRWRTSVKVNG